MKIISIKLENFQGIRNAEFVLNGQSASIYGDNATGKTTIFNAVTWLLFDKASTGAKNFNPKTKSADGDEHYLEHAAQLKIESDGKTFVLRKVLKEIWGKKRGSKTEEFDGHSVDYFVNGVPKKEKEFMEAVQALCADAERMKILTIPDYFPEGMSWDARRSILLDACEGVSDEEIIASNEALKDLDEFLTSEFGSRHTIDEYRKIASAAKSDINRHLQSIPGRIDEAARAIPENLPSESADEIEKKIAELSKRRSELEREKAMVLAEGAGSAVANLRRELEEERVRFMEAKSEHAERNAGTNEKVSAQIAALRGEIAQEESLAAKARREAEGLGREIEEMERLRARLLDEYAKVQAESWNEGEGICPACGRPLPEADVAAKREEYNVARSKRLEEINERGKTDASKEKIASVKAKIERIEVDLMAYEARIADANADIERLRGTMSTTIPFDQTEAFETISGRISELNAKIAEATNDAAKAVTERTGKLSVEIGTLTEEIEKLEHARAALETARVQKERIAELAAQEKDLAARFERFELGIFLCESFVKAKVRTLTECINEKFRSVRFRLFVEQINGGIKEDCEVMIPSEDGRMVPYAFANNAARITAGLEIIDVLSRHWGVSMPVFIDNAESVTRLPETDTQLVRLVVSEQDKKLRLELDERKAARAA